jgi:hypothetical protein
VSFRPAHAFGQFGGSGDFRQIQFALLIVPEPAMLGKGRRGRAILPVR